MLTPLWDVDNPVRRIQRPYMNYLLLGLNALIFVGVQQGQLISGLSDIDLVRFYGVTPVQFTSQHVPSAASAHEAMSLLSYSFFHANWLHLAGNMLSLWVFGDNIEDAVGHFRYLVFYLLCGIAGALVHILIYPVSPRPLIGASGAIAGLVMAYLLLHPRVHLWCLVFKRGLLKIQARDALAAWVVLQFGFAIFLAEEQVAWWAHVGGILAGGALILVMRLPGVPLFDKGLFTAPPAEVPHASPAASTDGFLERMTFSGFDQIGSGRTHVLTNPPPLEPDERLLLEEVGRLRAGEFSVDLLKGEGGERPAVAQRLVLKGYLERGHWLETLMGAPRWVITEAGRGPFPKQQQNA